MRVSQQRGGSGAQTLSELRAEAARCRACDLYKRATQTVFGEGRADTPTLMLVGEQPGDQEDLTGQPFVGPAGRLLDRALGDVGIDRSDAYVTNAVKHFKWVPRGKRRIHEKPNAAERRACHPWLEAEIRSVSPRLVVCLGATAAQALLGAGFRLTKHRGQLLSSAWAPRVIATIHPSALLRVEDRNEREAAYAAFVADLRKAASLAKQAA
jgi:uracil-DNA glycosylase